MKSASPRRKSCKASDGDIVAVTWDDAHLSDGWHDPKALELEIVLVTSVGRLIRVVDGYTTLAMTWHNDAERIADLLSIPDSQVVRLEILRPGNKPKRKR
jgi:hypothetical protein